MISHWTATKALVELPSLYSVAFQAKQLYTDLRGACGNQRPGRGEQHRALVACCAYYACKLQKEEGVCRPKAQVAQSFGVEGTQMSSACKLFKKLLAKQPYFLGLMAKSIETTDSIGRVLSQVLPSGLPKKTAANVQKEVRALDARLAKSGSFAGKCPGSILAAVVHVACKRLGVPVQKAALARAAGTTPVTMAKHAAALEAMLAS